MVKVVPGVNVPSDTVTVVDALVDPDVGFSVNVPGAARTTDTRP